MLSGLSGLVPGVGAANRAAAEAAKEPAKAETPAQRTPEAGKNGDDAAKPVPAKTNS
jgi:hypothetical protein